MRTSRSLANHIWNLKIGLSAVTTEILFAVLIINQQWFGTYLPSGKCADTLPPTITTLVQMTVRMNAPKLCSGVINDSAESHRNLGICHAAAYIRKVGNLEYRLALAAADQMAGTIV